MADEPISTDPSKPSDESKAKSGNRKKKGAVPTIAAVETDVPPAATADAMAEGAASSPRPAAGGAPATAQSAPLEPDSPEPDPLVTPMTEPVVDGAVEPVAVQSASVSAEAADAGAPKAVDVAAKPAERSFEAARPSEPPPWQSMNAPPPPPPSRLVPMLGAGLVGGIVGAIAATLVGGGIGGSGADTAAIEARIAGLEQVVTSSKDALDKGVNRIAAVETAIKTTSTTAEAAANVAAEARSVADQALARPIPEAGGTSAPVDLGPIETRIGAIESLAAAAATQSALAAAEQRIATLEARPVASGTDRSAAVAVSLTTLAAAIESGRPFVPELRAASAIVQDDDKLAALAGFADRGAPSAATLARDFDAVAPKLLEAINTEATGATQSSDLFAQLLDSASQVVIIRKVGDETSDAAAPVKKTREALQRGDVAEAIAAFDTMPETIRTLGAEWRQAAKSAVDAKDAVAKLRSDALAALGG